LKSKLDVLPPKLEMDYSVILNKPFLLATVPWTNTDARYDILKTFSIPEDILTNALARIPFEASVYYRAKISMVFQVSGTPMHQGILLAAALPINKFPSGDRLRLNSNLAAPHVFLNANESTSVSLEVPFYVNSKLAAIDLTGTTIFPGNESASYANVDLIVLNPLGVPTSGNTTISISVHAVFRELEFYVPHIDPSWVPFPGFLAEGFLGDFYDGVKASISKGLDGLATTLKDTAGDLLDKTRIMSNAAISAGRGFIKTYTGLHNPEIPGLAHRAAVQYRQNMNLVDTPNFIEKLDPYGSFTKIYDDHYFDTSIDEMSLKEIISKPQFIGSFKVTTADSSGTILWSRPITPAQEAIDLPYTDNTGSQITTVSTNLLQTFSKLSRFWKGSINIHLQSSMTNFHFCKLIVARDYSPDQKMLTSYPIFTDAANLMTETIEFSAGGQVQTIVMPYCSPLSQLPCSPDYEFNGLMHGMYYIYLYQPLVSNGSVPTTIEFNVYVSAGDDFDFFGYSTDPLRTLKDTSAPAFEAESMTEAPVVTNPQEEIDLKPHQNEHDQEYHMRPIKHVRDYIRRYYNVASQRVLSTELTANNGCFTVPVASLLGFNSSGTFIYRSTLDIVKEMFLGFRGGVKAKLLVNGTPKVQAWYLPPSFSLRSSVSPTTPWYRNEALPSAGSPAFPPIQEMFQMPNFSPPVPAIQLGIAYASQTVSIEAPNYLANNAALVMSNGAGATEPIAMSVCELEFEIPYMSPFKFVGNGDTWGTVAGGTNSVNDLGSLVFKIAQPALFEVGQSTAKAGVTFQLYVACSDEARLGFQVCAPITGYGSAAIAVGGRRALVSSIGPDGFPPQSQVKPTTVPGSAADLTPLYYTRSV